MSFLPGSPFLGLQRRRVAGESGPPTYDTPPAFRAVGARTGNSITTTYALPTRDTNDLLLLIIETANQDVTVSSDWTAVASSPQGTGTAGAADATRLMVWWHAYDGVNDPSNTVTVGAIDHHMGAIAAFSGVDLAAPINATAGAVDETADTTIDWPSVTTTRDNCLVLLIEAHALPDSNTNGQTSGQTNANLTGLAEVVDYNSASGNGGGVSVAAGVKTIAGAVGASTGTAAVAAKKGVITLALAPAT